MKAAVGIALSIWLAAAPLPAQTSEAAPSPASGIADVTPRIDQLFADYARKESVPGLAYGIVAEGKLVHFRGSGVQDLTSRRPVTSDSLFRIASMTKAFTALSILKLRDEGKLSLDAPAETYVPEIRGWTYPTTDSSRIRVRDLLNHVGGFVTDDPWGDRQQVLPEADFTRMLAAGVPFSRPPQTAMEYSNFGYALLGRIVAHVSGMPYRTYVERNLLKPLGMTASGFEVTDAPTAQRVIGYRWSKGEWVEEPTMKHGAFGAMGGLQVSASDYAKWVAFLLSAWPARDGPETGPVRRATVREMAQGSNFVGTRSRTRQSGEPCPQAQAYGMGLRVVQDCDLGLTLSHGGGYPGYGSFVLLLPENGVGIFMFGNRTYSGAGAQAWDAAIALLNANVLKWRDNPVSAAVAKANDAARRIYALGDVAAATDSLAMNFLMDKSAADWRSDIAAIKAQVGECATAEPIFPTGALSNAFRWNCERGNIDGSITLAPTNPPTIQSLRLFVAPPRP